MAKSEKTAEQVLERVSEALDEQSAFAWRVQNLLAFMAEALPDDELGTLPVKCALVNAKADMYKLAETLMDLVSEAKYG